MKKSILYFLICTVLCPCISAMVFTNEDRKIEAVFSVTFKGRKYADRRHLIVAPQSSMREFLQNRRKRQEDLFQVNVEVGRRRTNCGIQKGHVDRYEAVFSRGRCRLIRL